MNDGFRQAWQRLAKAPDEMAKEFEFNELTNLLEIACGTHADGSLAGVSRELSAEYIEHVLSMIEASDDFRKRLEAAIHAPTTFEYIKRFPAGMRRCSNAGVAALPQPDR